MSAPPVLPDWVRAWGTVAHSDGAVMQVAGLSAFARLGDRLCVTGGGRAIRGEVVAVDRRHVTAMLMGPAEGLSAGQRAWLETDRPPRPSTGWIGRVIDADGRFEDATPAPEGPDPADLHRRPPPGARRRGLGPRLSTGLAVTDTLIPLCRGQRLGVFAGSGVGKSMLLAELTLGLEADVVVIGLIGERGREVRDFVHRTLGPEGMARTVVIAATSDEPALTKRRAALLAMAVAEHFRDAGQHVLCMIDSLTRFAEAHREVALAAGEPPALRAFPASTAPELAALCERSGPGADDQGDITAVFTVLVAGSDMEEPVADMVRGTLDGHLILDRAIAERGRYPAVDVRRSVSRSTPGAWTAEEAGLAGRARTLIAAWEEAAPMIQAGLYEAGADPVLDEAVRLRPALDGFLAQVTRPASSTESFARLEALLGGG